MSEGPERSQGGALDRRTLLKRGAAVGVAAAASGSLVGAAKASGEAAPKPKRGGTLRVALPGGSAGTDNLDPNSGGGSPELFQSARQLSFSKLTDMDPSGHYRLQLAQSIEPNKDATVWTVRIKKGIEFHDGSPLTIDDVIYTLQRILSGDPTMAAAAGNIDMIDPQGFKKLDKYTMRVKLKRPWSDMFSAFGQRYLSIVKKGSKAPFTPQTFIGTGAFKLTGWTPGSHYTYVKNPNYFESGKPYLDAIDIVGIPDPVARANALVAGQVDAIGNLPTAQIPVIQGAGKQLVVNKGGSWTPFCMDCTTAPFTDRRVRQAMKMLLDRKQAVQTAVGGYGQVGNDLFAVHDPLYDSQIPQRHYDPQKAKALLKAAGALGQTFTLYTSDAVSGAVQLSLLFAQNAKAAGVNVNVQTVPASTFWSQTWGRVPFTFSSWGYRPFFTQWVQSFASFNAKETRWNDPSQIKAAHLVYKAAATGDPAKQKRYTSAAQEILWNDGGYIIPYFVQTTDAIAKNVRGVQPHVFPFLSWYRMWNFWLS